MNNTDEHAWTEQALELYKQFHQQPAFSGHEYRTARVLARRLHGRGGSEAFEHIGESGVFGIFRNASGLSMALRAELGGILVEERSGFAYASTVTGWLEGSKHPVSHACGHDVHLASMSATVQKLVTTRNKWSGSLVVIFQPAEETGRGAQRMLDDALNELVGQSEVLLTQHTSALPAGVVTLRAGQVTSAGKNIDVLFHGEGGHAAYSGWETNPVATAAKYVELLRQHYPESVSMKLTLGAFSAGTGHNTIPERAAVSLGLRATSDEQLVQFVYETRSILDNIGGVRAGAPRPDFNEGGEFSALSNDAHSTMLVHDALTRAGISTYWQTEQTWA